MKDPIIYLLNRKISYFWIQIYVFSWCNLWRSVDTCQS